MAKNKPNQTGFGHVLPLTDSLDSPALGTEDASGLQYAPRESQASPS